MFSMTSIMLVQYLLNNSNNIICCPFSLVVGVYVGTYLISSCFTIQFKSHRAIHNL